ncbi:MAG: preprotein translocase subunit YajC [Pseudomonadota bacterium]
MHRLSLAGLSSLFLLPLANAEVTAAAAPTGPGIGMQLLPLILIGIVFYFLLIRPQSQRAKKHREMIGALKKGDTVITSGGLIGKVTKVAETEVTVELADGVRVRLVRGMIADVRDKTAPVAAND